jgi:hypothetical protein
MRAILGRTVAGVAVVALLIPMPAAAETGCILYQHRDYGGAHWHMARNSFMQMGGGEPIGATGMIDYYRRDWNDQVSSFRVVGHRCTLTLYEHAGTWGYGATFRSTVSYKYVGSRWNDKASWAVCSCIGAPRH